MMTFTRNNQIINAVLKEANIILKPKRYPWDEFIKHLKIVGRHITVGNISLGSIHDNNVDGFIEKIQHKKIEHTNPLLYVSSVFIQGPEQKALAEQLTLKYKIGEIVNVFGRKLKVDEKNKREIAYKKAQEYEANLGCVFDDVKKLAQSVKELDNNPAKDFITDIEIRVESKESDEKTKALVRDMYGGVPEKRPWGLGS